MKPATPSELDTWDTTAPVWTPFRPDFVRSAAARS